MAGMKQVLLMIAVVALVGCGGGKKEEAQGPSQPEPATPPQGTEKPKSPKASPTKLIADPVVEKAIREKLKKPEGELTEADLAKVTPLNLWGTKITDVGLKDVAKLQQLKWLHLINTKITDVGLKDVAKLQQLETLNLVDTKITDAGLKEVAKLQNLTRLYLGFTQITDAGLKDVAKLQNLTGLYLLDTKVTKAGVAELKKALPKCQFSTSFPTK